MSEVFDMLRIHSIETFGTHEGPGLRLVIFLQGCQFRCLYCHNPDTWQIQAGVKKDIKYFVDLVHKQKVYFGKNGGITISGGEPLLQRQELLKLFLELKKQGIHTVLDTNGSILDEATRELLAMTDLVLLDIKHIDPVWHQKLTHGVNTTVLEFAKFREDSGKPMWLRYVLVPGYNDQPHFLHKWGESFGSYSSVERVEILPYHTLGVYKYDKLGISYPLQGVKPPSPQSIEQARKIFGRYFPKVYIR